MEHTLRSQQLNAGICEAEVPRTWVVPRRRNVVAVPLGTIASQVAAFSAPLRVSVTLRVGVEKNTKPRVPGTLQLQKACQWEHDTATALFPPRLSPWHHSCAGNLSLTNDFFDFSTKNYCCA